MKLTCMYTQDLFCMVFILLDHRHMLLILMFQTLPGLAIRAPSATRHSYLVILRRLSHSILSCGILCCFVWLMGQFWPPLSIKLLLLLLLVFTFDKYSALVDSNDGPKMVLHIEGNYLVHLHTSQLCLCLRTFIQQNVTIGPSDFVVHWA